MSVRHRRLRELIARGVTWTVCLGLTERDAGRVHASTGAAIAQSVGAHPAAFRPLLHVVWDSLGPVVRNGRRWDWRHVLSRLLDVPVHAAMAALPPALVVSLCIALTSESIVGGAVGGAVTAATVLLLRAVRMLRRQVRSAYDIQYRRKMSQPEARWLTPANFLTSLRIPGSVLVAMFVVWDNQMAAFLTLVGLLVSDVVDGYVARRWQHVTTLGGRLDPVADRLMVSIAAGAALALVPTGASPLRELLIAMLVRDSALLLGGLVPLLDGTGLPPTNASGKVASVLEFSGVISLYGAAAFGRLDDEWTVRAVSGVVGAAVIIGAVSLSRYARSIRHVKPPLPAWPRAHGDTDPELDPYTHDGVRALLDDNPLNATLVALYEELLRRSGPEDDLLEPLELVERAIKQTSESMVSRQRRPARTGAEEVLSNLEQLRHMIEILQS